MARPPLLASGDTVDRFKVLKPLGAGGFGEVYLAIGVTDNRDVALKVLRKDIAGFESQLPMFLSEAEVYKAVSHPNVVNYVSSGETPRFHYVALEHIRGTSLRRKLNREGPSGIVSNFSWMQDLVLALHAAHQKGIIHQDIKPENIMISHDFEVKLIDFGIAKSSKDEDSREEALFNAGTGGESGALCTLGYASPEQLLGRPVDFRTDIFSLGLVFFEMITGRPLMNDISTSKAVLKQHMLLESGKRRLLPTADGDDGAILDGLEALLRSMLRFDPDRRCTSTGDLVLMMQNIADSAGGALQLLSQDDAKRLAQRELVDTHFWNAMNLLSERKVFDAVDELSHISAFAMAIDKASLPALIRELDVILINIKPDGRKANDPLSVSEVDFLSLLNRILDIYSSLCKKAELPLRERMICERAKQSLSSGSYERFLQDQSVHPPHSYTFSSSYVRLIYKQNELIATRIWARLLDDLVRRELIVQAEREKRKIEDTFGTRILEPGTMERYGHWLEKCEQERVTFEQAIACLEGKETPEKLVKICRNYLDRYPQDVPALKKLRRYLRKLEHQADATEILYSIGVVQFTGGYLGQAMKSFVAVLDENPKHEAATLALYTCFLVDGKKPQVPLSDYRALREFIYKKFGVVTPAIQKLEVSLTGGPGDKAVYRKCVALLKKRKRSAMAAQYLIRLGAFCIKAGANDEARRAFDEAISVGKKSAAIYRNLMTVQGIRHFYNPMELSRKAAEADQGNDSDSSIDFLRKKTLSA